MKEKWLRYWMLFTCLVAGFIVFAQDQRVSSSDVVKIDTLTKVMGAILTLGGVFMGYLQMRMAYKMAELEAKMVNMVHSVKDQLNTMIKEETTKLEDKIRLSSKEIESKMATRHDLNNISTVAKLQHENIKLELQGIKESLKK